MNFTVRIENNNQKAQSIVNMLKELAKDYSFIRIIEEDQELSGDMVEELEYRYNYMVEHPNEWKTWEEVKSNLLNS